MNFLISGGAGFIGSYLCDKFISEGHTILCIDNLLSGKMKNIKHLLKKSNFYFLEKDIIEQIDINYFFDKLDYIFHFASLASLPYITKYPIHTELTNSIGTYNLLKLAVRYKSKFILASTSEIYGDPDIHPQVETYFGNVNTIGPRSVYDESKRFAETLTMSYFNNYGIDIKIVRIFNTYGPRMACDGRVVLNFIHQAINDENITVYGDGQQTRSFCYIDDLIDGIYKLANSDYNNPINIGNPQEITIEKLANKIIELTNSKSKIIYKSLPVNDPLKRCPDIYRAKEILQWEPKIDLESGLNEVIQYEKENNIYMS